MSPREDSVPLLKVCGVGKSFGATKALDRVDFQLYRGEVHALLGENGAGKSTLVRILSGAIRPDAGTMSLDGRPYCPNSPLEGIENGISVVYQELTLAPHLTVAENIMLGREPRTRGRLDLKLMRTMAADALKAANHAEIRPEDKVGDLGMGARQVVEIARAMVNESKVLILDEPTSSLTAEDGERLFDLVASLKGRGVGIIYISHFLEEVDRTADSFTVFRDGRNAGSGRLGATGLDEIIRLMVGRDVSDLFPRVPHKAGGTVLAVRGLKGTRMDLPVSLDLKRGEILGIAGLVGSGRTEFMRTVFGLDPAESGGLESDGASLGPGSPWTRIRQGFGFLSEDRQGEGLAMSLSIADNILLSDFSPCRRGRFLSLTRQAARAGELTEAMGLRSSGPWQKAGELSGGNQQKAVLARLMNQDASILLLDEPTRGIDVVSKTQVYRWMGKMAGLGKSIVFVSSYFPELLGVCDRIAVFFRGSLVEVREAGQWNMRSMTSAATLGRVIAGPERESQ